MKRCRIKELEILYEWAEENNMKFNGKKFHVVRYGKDKTFYRRKTLLMKILFKTLVVPHIDFCTQL